VLLWAAEIHLGQIGDDVESGGLPGKDLGVLPRSKLFEPGRRTSHLTPYRALGGAHAPLLEKPSDVAQ
jgi:hypothetical protein